MHTGEATEVLSYIATS